MKLILTQEVDGLGAPGDVVEVKDGYGRNYLLPRSLAVMGREAVITLTPIDGLLVPVEYAARLCRNIPSSFPHR